MAPGVTKGMPAVWKIGPALAAGNTIVLKPSDTTPASTALLGEIAQEALPPGVLNVVCGDRDTGRALVEHPVPGLVSITGSTRAGIEVARSASADVKRTHLELGGKAPAVVFADADLAEAAEGIGVGDSIGLMCRNHRGFIDAVIAASKVGANVLVLNTAFSGPQLADGRALGGSRPGGRSRLLQLVAGRPRERAVERLLPRHAR